jgi:hypothetical protein
MPGATGDGVDGTELEVEVEVRVELEMPQARTCCEPGGGGQTLDPASAPPPAFHAASPSGTTYWTPPSPVTLPGPMVPGDDHHRLPYWDNHTAS